jgi:hypothetical protein
VEALAKQTLQCDDCKKVIDTRRDTDLEDSIQAKLKNLKGDPQVYHFCAESCLASFLQKRIKKKNARASYDAFAYEIDLSGAKVK